MAQSTFEFLSFSDLQFLKEKSTKSRIRRHAMKDIGLSRRRPKKRKYEMSLMLLSPSPTAYTVPQRTPEPFLSWPVEIDTTAWKLITQCMSLILTRFESTLEILPPDSAE
jgi:hypothetical protein